MGLSACFAAVIPSVSKTNAKMARYAMSNVKVPPYLDERLPLAMRSLAASLAFETGLNCAIVFSHSGNELIGNGELLMNVGGKAGKLTMAISESGLFMEMDAGESR